MDQSDHASQSGIEERRGGETSISAHLRADTFGLKAHTGYFVSRVFFRVGTEQHLDARDDTVFVFPYFGMSRVKSK
jgi:hypothetical protein